MQYLVFPNETTARKATGWWSKKTGWVGQTPRLQIEVRGVLYNDDGEYDDTGETIKEPSHKDGFFIDVIKGVVPADAKQYIITPARPDFVLA